MIEEIPAPDSSVTSPLKPDPPVPAKLKFTPSPIRYPCPPSMTLISGTDPLVTDSITDACSNVSYDSLKKSYSAPD